ncbi:Choline dehydrogenase, mitochondrial [Halotydeus destructor]|nr:Choline dehydrogenase, mitochondrial [Halotydeus destructor]
MELSVLLLNYLISAANITSQNQGESEVQLRDAYDFIIIGGGTAGLVVADRLSQNPNINVLVLEMGGIPSLYTQIPFLPEQLEVLNSRMYNITSPVCPNGICSNSRVGQVLGGSSTSSAMVYDLNANDFDKWSASGLSEWSYEKILPFIRKLEDTPCGTGQDKYRGRSGPLKLTVNRGRGYFFSTLAERFNKAASSLNYSVGDYNGGYRYHFGNDQVTVKDGRRQSSYTAFIGGKQRSNLDIVPFAFESRILFEDKVATGVEWYMMGPKRVVAKASREVILSGGALSTPQILMLSGIGPAEVLKKFKIPVVAESRGVGQNLQNHIGADLEFEFNFPILGDSRTTESNYFQWRRNGTGVFGSTPDISIGRFATTNSVDEDDVKCALRLQVQNNSTGITRLLFRSAVIAPESRGYLTLQSPNFFDQPRIEPNYLKEEIDEDNLHQCLKRMVKVHRENKPHPEAPFLLHNENGRDTDPMAVVDANLQVKHVQRLRVIDASIMPNITRADTMASVYVIAEKGADLIVRKHD